MTIKRFFSLILSITLLLCAFAIPTNATETIFDENSEIIIENGNISEETKAKIIAYYTNADKQDNGATAYGLTCTLLGHKLESSTVRAITHKVRTTSPRCLEKTYDYEACTRCDYEDSVLVSSIYIACC